MKNILDATFLQDMIEVTSNMYRMGWDERNGGNVSYLLKEEELKEYLDLNNIVRTIPLMGLYDTNFDISPLIGKYFIVTGTGKYFKNVKKDPETNLGIVRIPEDGKHIELLWGYKDGGRTTSEFPAHMMCHMARLKVDSNNRIVIHSHPTNTLAMNYVCPLEDKIFSHTLWQMSTECIVVFPEGVGVLPWMLCGTKEIGEATAKKMQDYRLVIWGLHGVYASGKDMDETFGLIETVEKAATIYNLIGSRKIINTITNDNLKEIANYFKVNYRKEFLD